MSLLLPGSDIVKPARVQGFECSLAPTKNNCNLIITLNRLPGYEGLNGPLMSTKYDFVVLEQDKTPDRHKADENGTYFNKKWNFYNNTQ